MQINHLLATEYMRMQEREFTTPEWRHQIAAKALRKRRWLRVRVLRPRAWRFARAAAVRNQAP